MRKPVQKIRPCFLFGILAHVIIFLTFLILTRGASGGEDRLYWIIFRAVDFPLGILSELLIKSGISSFLGAYWFHFFHGIAGALWWGILSLLTCKMLSKRHY